MMKHQQVRLFVAFMMTCLLSIITVGAKDRVAPEMPEPQKFVMGKEYVIYNPAFKRFMFWDESSTTIYAYKDQAEPFFVNNILGSGTIWSSGTYLCIQNDGTRSSNYNLYASSGDYLYYNRSSYLYSEYAFRIDSVKGGYAIFSLYRSRYVGCYSESSLTIRTNYTKSDTANITWQFFDADEGLRYAGRLGLLTAMESAEANGYNVDKYDALYEDVSASGRELMNAAIELKRAIEFSNTLTKSSLNEYPMLFTRTGPWWKVSKGYSSRVVLDYYNNSSYWNSWSYVTSYVDDPRMNNYDNSSNMTQWDLPVTVAVDENAVFAFYYYCYGNYNTPRLTILLDGQPLRQISYEEGNLDRRYTVPLTLGVHTVTLRFERYYGNSSSTKVNLYDFAVMKAGEEICVNLLEPGSLGTEVLYNVDNVNMVRRLKVKGPMNDNDWQRIYMMNYLNSLDLSECTITEIKASQVSRDAHSSLTYLTTFKLPATLKTIGEKAFYRTNIVGLDFPDGLEKIGDNAFTQTAITTAILPQSVRSIGSYAFSKCGGLQEVFLPDSASVGTYAFNECSNLKTANLPKAMTTVPDYMFYNCVALDTVDIGDELQSIGNYAFYNCRKMKMQPLPNTVRSIRSFAFYNCDGLNHFTLPSNLTYVGDYGLCDCDGQIYSTLPSKLTYIGNYAFWRVKLDTVRIAPSATVGERAFGYSKSLEVTIGKNASIGKEAFYTAKVPKVFMGEGVSLGETVFSYCDSLEVIEFPTTYYSCTGQQLANITSGKLEKVVLKSPTMVQGSAYTSFFSGVNTTNTTIYVPSFQRNNYRLDSYWYNYPIEGFDVSDVTDWTINNAITFGASERFAEQSNLTFTTLGSLKVNGDAAMVINNLETNRSGNSFSMLLSNCDNMSISGSFVQDYYTAKNTWNFITLPFDFKVSEVVSLVNAQMVMRYYDGARRATSGTGSNWKNLPADSIVPAGSGFILMTSKDGWVRFTEQCLEAECGGASAVGQGAEGQSFGDNCQQGMESGGQHVADLFQ